MTPEEREQREALADRLENVHTALAEMLFHWQDSEADEMILGRDEYPFDRALEDLTAEVRHAVWKIRERNEEELERAEVRTMTVRELRAALFQVEDQDRPVVAYSDAVGWYLNISGVTAPPEHDGPAVVIETTNDFDTRQF